MSVDFSWFFFLRVLFEKTGESDIAQNLHIIQKKKKFSFETIKKKNCGYLFLFGFCFLCYNGTLFTSKIKTCFNCCYGRRNILCRCMSIKNKVVFKSNMSCRCLSVGSCSGLFAITWFTLNSGINGCKSRRSWLAPGVLCQHFFLLFFSELRAEPCTPQFGLCTF